MILLSPSRFKFYFFFLFLIPYIPKCFCFYKVCLLLFCTFQNGLLSALPYLVSFIVALLAGQVADFLRYRGMLSTGNVRKLMTGTGNIPLHFACISVTANIVNILEKFQLSLSS